MAIKASHEMFKAEEEHKERVYRSFEQDQYNKREKVAQQERYVLSGAYEEQEAFTAHGNLSKAEKQYHSGEALVKGLYRKPYFAHIEVEFGKDDTQDFYLSDCTALEEAQPVEGGGLLVPFKYDKRRPISKALFHCYQSKKDQEQDYVVEDEQQNKKHHKFRPVLICDDEIHERELLNVVQFLPVPEEMRITADEFLEEKLSENRNDPNFRNIISTLQQQQFEIIEKELQQSFVVQGCAGSGKSQCMFHRLFFMRDELDDKGWEKVLLLTPSQLFRDYSKDIIRRYRLSDVHNCSVSVLYKDILESYDPRFRNRQYCFELSEEYLPDRYLREIYQDDMIEKIDTEIENAIQKYVQAGYNALGIEMPSIINTETVCDLTDELGKELEAFDKSEQILQKDPEYLKKREEYEAARKELLSAQKADERSQKELTDNREKRKAVEEKLEEVEEARTEYNRLKGKADRLENARTALERLNDGSIEQNGFGFPAEYSRRLYELQTALNSSYGGGDDEYLQFLAGYLADTEAELSKLIGVKKPEKALEEIDTKYQHLMEKQKTASEKLESVAAELEERERWLRDRAGELEGIRSQRALRRSELERARYFLSRLESTVFEQEVWNALAPLKEQCGIQTVQIEKREDGHQKESKILYKSDLLFYLMIYTKLHDRKKLPRYDFICIDEGQDLHQADYELLRSLYPKAVLNVFGDVAQVLHESCGIRNWKGETGIDTVYALTRNYRNTAAIVDFCNRKFNTHMEFVGKVREQEKPQMLRAETEICRVLAEKKAVVIVRDREEFDKLSRMVSGLEYFDTKAEHAKTGKMACYSIFAAKGLEFPSVLVYAENMTVNQKVVACTRAMETLYYYE